MTVKPFLLKKSYIFISMALLSPCVLAAADDDFNKPLNFNYTRQDNNADPRLALQSRGCRAKSEPLEIRIKLDNTTLNRDRRLTVKIKGAGYLYNYTGLEAIDKKPRMIKVGNTDIKQTFYTPWQVKVTENIEGKFTPWGSLQADYKLTPKYRFCFDKSKPASKNPSQWQQTYGYVPIFEKLPDEGFSYNAIIRDRPDFYYSGSDSEFKKFCAGKRFLRGESLYTWSGLFEGKPLPYLYRVDKLQHKPEDSKDIVLTSMFSLQESREAGQTERGTFYNSNRARDIHFNTTNYIVGSGEAKTEGGEAEFVYQIPDDFTRPDENQDKSKYVKLGIVPPELKIDKGEWVLRVNNRNISAISLIIEDRSSFKAKTDNQQDTRPFPKVVNFTWQADPSKDPFNNTLFLVTETHNNNQEMQFAASAAKDNKNWYNDLYQTAGFYKETTNMFRGTLAAGTSLDSTAYNAYMKQYTPLSLPAKMQGAINLVNTDSLEFAIHRPAGNGSTWSISLTGKPLEFAPLLKNNKVAYTAMEVRNVCY